MMSLTNGDPRRDRIGVLASSLLFVLSSSATAAGQQAKGHDNAAADALFRAGRALVEAGDYAAGCPKFDASLALSPAASTLLNIGKCHEHEGKLAMAWSDYNQALVINNSETRGQERQKRLEDFAKECIAELEPRLPKLRIVAQHPPPELRVTRDGGEVPAAAFGEALPVDPGRHEIVASAPGYRSATYAVMLDEGKTVSVEASLTKESHPAKQAAAPSEGGVPTWVWISGGAGLALAGASAFFLADNRSAVSALQANCQDNARGTYCSPGYDYDSDNARKNRGMALFLGLGGAGVVAIGAAIVGFVRAPSSRGPETPAATAVALPWLAPGGAGATLAGRF